jgi:hypothetical protein
MPSQSQFLLLIGFEGIEALCKFFKEISLYCCHDFSYLPVAVAQKSLMS